MVLDPTRDTIAAIATPPGRGGIGILRLSGPAALACAAPLLALHKPLEPNRARFCEIIEPASHPSTDEAPSLANTTKLDEAIVTFYEGPRSYTGEDVVEIAAHGSPVLLDFLLRQTLRLGARLAEPGEFTERAFLAGRLDLTQAEAVRDLIDAQTLYQARVAATQLGGALSRRIRPVKDALIHLIATMEAGIDFAEDDTPTLTADQFVTAAAPIAEELAALAHSFQHGRLVHDGLSLAIIGAPNVGKSSLFNRLVERERAIVTATPGTTRDLVTERISIAGIPIELIDTAGLRHSADEAERLGIAKSREAMADADLVLLVFNAADLPAATYIPSNLPPQDDLSAKDKIDSAAITLSEDIHSFLLGLENCPSIIVLNKSDLLLDSSERPQETVATKLPLLANLPMVLTSAHTGAGIDALRDAIQQQLQLPAQHETAGLLTNLRQHQAVSAAESAIAAAMAAAAERIPAEMLLLDLYAALRSLDGLTGQTTSDDILNLIFSTFCIGK